MSTPTDETMYRVDGRPAVAFYTDETDDGESYLATVFMVGDDRRYKVPRTRLHALAEGEACGSCGQIGCPCA